MSGQEDASRLLEAVRRGQQHAPGSGGPEATLREEVQPVLAELLHRRGVRSAARDEVRLLVPSGPEAHLLDAPLATLGRADAIYNRFVIEFEPPGSLRPSVMHGATRHAISQVQQYLRGAAEENGIPLDRVAGCAFDGSWIVYVTWERGAWAPYRPRPVDLDSLGALLDSLQSLASGRGLTATNLDEDFGRESEVARVFIPALLSRFREGEVTDRGRSMFQQWSVDLGNAAGLFSSANLDEWDALCSSLGLPGDEESAAVVLFSLQTYFALVAKLVALIILEGATGASLVPALAGGGDVWEGFARLESGALTAPTGTLNAIEPGIFSWYAGEGATTLSAPLARLAELASEYSAEIVEITPLVARDVLKDLYQRLVPRPIRHRLGEYYTPDWLAQRVVNQVAGSESTLAPDHRVLDPACGSGTFLVEVISRMVAHIGEDNQAEGLQKILRNVVGFDLSPLAVQASKVNYLLALSPLLRHKTAPVFLPVFLADSVSPPRRGGLLEGDVYVLDSVEGDWTIPALVAESQLLPDLGVLLRDAIREGHDPAQVRRTLTAHFPALASLSDPGLAAIDALLEKLRSLEEADRNGMWWGLISNAFAPSLQGRFDSVVGNPPWVSWETLPEKYRRATDSLWLLYGLRPDAPPDRRQASVNVRLDLAMLFVATCVDRYLTDTGRLGFVITASVFQSELAGRGFRRRKLPPSSTYRFTHIDDMTSLRVFEDAANQTAVLIADRRPATQERVPVTRWRVPRGHGRLAASLELSKVSEIVEVRDDLFGEPVAPTDPASPLLIMPEDGLIASRPLRRRSPYLERIREGINTRGANGVFFVEILENRGSVLRIRNMAHEGRNSLVSSIEGLVERAAVKQLLRGQDVERGRAEPSAGVLFFHDPVAPSSPLTPTEAKARFPEAFDYISQFEEVLRSRRRFRAFDPTGDEWLGMYSVTTAAVATHKVVIREVAQGMVAAAVHGADVIPDHKLYVVQAATPQEADLLAAVLNSPVIDFMVRSFAISTSVTGSVLRYLGVRDLSGFAGDISSEASMAATLGLTLDDYLAIDRIAQRELGRGA